MKLYTHRDEAGILGLQAVADWLADIWTLLKYFATGFVGEAVRWGTTIWGLVLLIATLVWTLLTHIVPVLTLLLSTVTGLATGTWNLAPPAGIMNVLAIANTLCPLEEALAYGSAYGVLKAGLALYRWYKGLIPTESGV
jgi:hypothetical protein